MSVELRHHAKFRGDRSNRCRDIAIFGFFKDVGGRHLGFLKFQIFNDRNSQEGGRTASLCQISSKSLEPWPRYDFSIFQDGGSTLEMLIF